MIIYLNYVESSRHGVRGKSFKNNSRHYHFCIERMERKLLQLLFTQSVELQNVIQISDEKKRRRSI